MLYRPLIEKLNLLKLSGMAEGLVEQEGRDDLGDLEFSDRLGLLIDREVTLRENRALTRRLREAKLRYQAAIEDVDLRQSRGLDKGLVLKLADCQWILKHKNILIVGATGAGKSYLACALAHKACREGYRAGYFGMGKLAESFEIARADGSFPRLHQKLDRLDLLILDDFGLAPLTAKQKHDLFQILEDRYERRATIMASQFPVDKWHQLIDDPTLADAILDRVIHNAYRLIIKGENMRKKKHQHEEK